MGCSRICWMDFCVRVFQQSCKELGLPSHGQTWIAYADDLKDKSVTEEEASRALKQLEAASAFVGLRLNVPKTEVMAKGIKKEEHRPEKPAFKEKVSVKYDNGDFRGWKTLAKWAHLIGIELPKEQRGKESMVVIKFDDGEHITAEERGGGWIKDEDGDLHRMRKLGFETVIEKGKEVCCL